MANQKNTPACSFCSRTEEQVGLLVPGPKGIFICDRCATLCYDLVEEYMGEAEKKDKKDKGFHLNTLPRPTEIIEWPMGNVNPIQGPDHGARNH